MRKRRSKTIKYLSLIFAIIVVVLFVYSLVNYTLLKNKLDKELNKRVETYGYAAVFTVGFLVEIIPQPIASAVIPYANGLVLKLKFEILLIVTLLAVISSSLIGYWLGRLWGKKLTIKIFGKEDYDKYSDLFKRYGSYALTIAAFTPFPYIPVVPGVFKMKLEDFIIYGLIPRMTYYLIFCYVLFLVL